MVIETEGNSTRPIMVMSVDTRTLLTKFLTLAIGETITYESMNQIIGRDVRDKAYYNLQSARKAALREGVVMGTVTKVGLQRLNDEGIVETGNTIIQRIHKSSRKAARIMACVKDFDHLPKQTQTQHNAAMSVLGAVIHLSSAPTQKKLEGKVSQTGASLPLQKTLDELSK